MSGYKIYQNNQIQGASPLGLVLLTYEALNKALGATRMAILAHQHEAEVRHTGIAIEALMELSSSLDMRAGGAVAQSLISLYVYMMNRLREGMCEGRTDHIDEVLHLAGELREAWMRLVELQSNDQSRRLANASV